MQPIVLANGQTCAQYMESRGVKFKPDYNFFIKNTLLYAPGQPLFPKTIQLLAFAKHKNCLYADNDNGAYVVYGEVENQTQLDLICVEWFGDKLVELKLITDAQYDEVFENEAEFALNRVIFSTSADEISDDGEFV